MAIYRGAKRKGNAFQGDYTRSFRPYGALPDRTNTKFVLGTEFKKRNNITHHQMLYCIQRKYLAAIRRGGAWQVASIPWCRVEMLEYLGLDSLAYDAENPDIPPS